MWQGMAQALWQLNEALSTACLSSETSLFTSLAAPVHPSGQHGVTWHSSTRFQTSALCAAALDSVTFPFRAISQPSALSGGIAGWTCLEPLKSPANLSYVDSSRPVAKICVEAPCLWTSLAELPSGPA